MDFQPKKQSIVCEKTILLEETPRQSILDPHETLVQGIFILNPLLYCEFTKSLYTSRCFSRSK